METRGWSRFGQKTTHRKWRNFPPLKRRQFKKNTWKSSSNQQFSRDMYGYVNFREGVPLDTWWCFRTPKVYCSCDWNFHPRHVPRFHGPKSGRCNFSKRRKNPRSHRTVNFIRTFTSYHIIAYGCFLKWWYPQIIHFNRVFHYKPSILGYPYFCKHPYHVDLQVACQFISHLMWPVSVASTRTVQSF